MRVFLTILTAMLCASSHAENMFAFSSAKPTGKEAAVLVLAPGQNMDGSFFLDEPKWSAFARKNNLGLMSLNYSSDIESLYGEKKNGYFYAEHGSGQALLDEIRRAYGKDLPVIIFGFSGGAQFTASFVNWAPERILAWCAYSFPMTPEYPESGTNARGIVACGELDSKMWFPSYAFFYKGRSAGKNLIWANLKNTDHARSEAFEDFVRAFFREELDIFAKAKDAPNDAWVDVYIPEKTAEHPEGPLLSPFRTERLLEMWKEIHTP